MRNGKTATNGHSDGVPKVLVLGISAKNMTQVRYVMDALKGYGIAACGGTGLQAFSALLMTLRDVTHVAFLHHNAEMPFQFCCTLMAVSDIRLDSLDNVLAIGDLAAINGLETEKEAQQTTTA